MAASTYSGSAPVIILVVDDHPSSAATLARIIAQLGPGVRALSVESGAEALTLMQNKKVDILITDLVMPGMTGLELVEKIRILTNNRPAYTILMTAYEVPGLKEIARHLMVNEVVCKPIQPDSICRIITRVMEVGGFSPLEPPSGGLPGSEAPLSFGSDRGPYG